MEVFLFVMVGWVFSVCLHEFGHAVVAYYGGDITVKEKGYLTLNPIHYTHPVFSLLLPLVYLVMGGIGLPGGAVFINDGLIRSRNWRVATSLAGPLMNVALAIALAFPFWLGAFANNPNGQVAATFAFLLFLQITSVFFNLLPIPPLDGFQAIADAWMSNETKQRLMGQSNTFFFVLLILFWQVPDFARMFFVGAAVVMTKMGVDPGLVPLGLKLFQFWKS